MKTSGRCGGDVVRTSCLEGEVGEVLGSVGVCGAASAGVCRSEVQRSERQ